VKESSQFKLIICSVALLGLLVTSFASWSIYQSEKIGVIGYFQRDVDTVGATVSREIFTNLEALRTLGVLFHQGNIPSYESFTNEADKILARHTEITALEWVPRVPSQDKPAFLKKIRHNFPDYRILAVNRQGKLSPTEEMHEYYPVTYIAPLKGNQQALGFDLTSSPVRLAALTKTRDKAVPQVSESIQLIQDAEPFKAFVAFLPVYRGDPKSISKRRKLIQGFVLGAFHIGDIFDNAQIHSNNMIDLQMLDTTSSLYQDELYSKPAKQGGDIKRDLSYKYILADVWGRQWTIIAAPTQGYIDSHRGVFAEVFFCTGLFFTFSLCMFLNFLFKRNSTISNQVKIQTQALSEANSRLEFLSRSDELTGLYNRRYFNEFLENEWARAIRNESHISFILIDIDSFKAYNDNYGHLQGDQCLVKVAQCLQKIPTRATDIVARYGGEEFAIVLGETEDPLPVAKRCVEKIEGLNISHEHSSASKYVTISAGVCTFKPGRHSDAHAVIDHADKALYQAKDLGRNRVEVAAINLTVTL
jgi:diguanylate cyclase (GGDEF)-like protein